MVYDRHVNIEQDKKLEIRRIMGGLIDALHRNYETLLAMITDTADQW